MREVRLGRQVRDRVGEIDEGYGWGDRLGIRLGRHMKGSIGVIGKVQICRFKGRVGFRTQVRDRANFIETRTQVIYTL